MGQLSPMMQNYLDTKEEYKDCIVFYRLGDFYEMFFDDAKLVSRELELTLTGKACGLEERAPMCGVPFHSADTFIHRLVDRGYKVAICEQMEDPKQAKGLVRREVTRIITPGTNSFTEAMEDDRNNFLMGIVAAPEGFGMAVTDVSTGEFHVAEIEDANKLLDEINRYSPSEIIANDALYLAGLDIADLKNRLQIVISTLEPRFFSAENCGRALCEHFGVKTTAGLGLDDVVLGKTAAGCVMQYLIETQKCSLSHITHIQIDQTGRTMLLDRNTRRNLELVETMREKQKRGSLLWVLDKTKTAMGARMLRSGVERPLLIREEIEKRYDAIDNLNRDPVTREELREYLGPVYDLERLIGKISYQTINPRDMLALCTSLAILPSIRTVCEEFPCELFRQLTDALDPLEDLTAMISAAITDEPPLSLREGGILKEGYNDEVDRLRRAKTEGKEWLADLAEKEKEKTGIKNLKIDYNKVFGYYLVVTKSFLSQVPDNWIRKQTLTTSERYTTPELKEMEETILGASDRLYQLEYALFCELRDNIAGHIERIQKTASVIAQIDMLCSLAYVAEQENYCRPKLRDDGVLKIKKGRHPVIEKMIEHDLFIPNDTELNEADQRIAIITGPNMAGKSTYMRQTALIQLMAQLGSFVPADSAELSIVDRIFTRVGASDDLASGQSTFMVEMTEVANILHHATKDSLIILDEIGRGTSTFDGLSIAWAVVEEIADQTRIGAKTLFATHYHELTELGSSLDGVKNYCIAVKEDGEDVIFLRKIVKGGADRSYGIHVAKLAGVPEEVLARARAISDRLENQERWQIPPDAGSLSAGEEATRTRLSLTDSTDGPRQLSIFDTLGDDTQMDDILCEIRDTDLTNITPMQAMNLVNKWQQDISDKW
ncbi:MAG: DNA mismatch repair protein MutS [Eubacterium sp.]|nr:DNA mismatch repair protein MutS [Eubacterium sp.]